MADSAESECPICCKSFGADIIEVHVNRCIFLHATEEDNSEKKKEPKRGFSAYKGSPTAETKKPRMASPFARSPKTVPAATVTKTKSASVVLSSDDENDSQNAVSQQSISAFFIHIIIDYRYRLAETTTNSDETDQDVIPR